MKASNLAASRELMQRSYNKSKSFKKTNQLVLVELKDPESFSMHLMK